VPRRAQLNARNGFIATPDFDILTHARICAQIRTDLGGYAAEQLVFGTACSGSGGDVESDLARATFRAQQAELSYGFGETLSWQPSNTDMQRLSARQRARIEQQLQQALKDTQQAFRTNRADLERIADVLIRERELDRARIAELLREVAVAEPSSDPRGVRVQNGHGFDGGSATHDANGPE